MPLRVERAFEQAQDRRPLAAAHPEFCDTDLGRSDRKREVAVSAPGKKIVEVSGEVVEDLRFNQAHQAGACAAGTGSTSIISFAPISSARDQAGCCRSPAASA